MCAPATPRLVVVVGPTAGGKTELAVHIAQAIGGEIISADSQQVYRGMDIGTGKATPLQRQLIPHHLLDVLSPKENMTAARFVELADECIADLHARGKAVIVAGGTGLYLRALLYGLFDGPPADPALRDKIEQDALDHADSPESAAVARALWAKLKKVDPDAAQKIDPHDKKRLIRALEVFQLTGVPISEHQRAHDYKRLPPRYDMRVIGLGPEREPLYQRINERVDSMFEQGWISEVKTLLAQGCHATMRSFAAIGYREICAHLRGDVNLQDATQRIKKLSRKYARRQLAWFGGERAITWYKAASQVDIDALGAWVANK